MAPRLFGRRLRIALIALSLIPVPARAGALENDDVLTVRGGAVVRIAASDSSQTLLTPESVISLNGIDVDATGTIFVTEGNTGGFGGYVHRVDPGSAALTRVGTAGVLREPTDLDILGDGMLLVSDPDALGGVGGLILVNPTSGAQSIRYRGSGASRHPSNAAVDDFGTIYFLAGTLDSASVFRLAPGDSIATEILRSSDLNANSSMIWHGGQIFATKWEFGTGRVLRIDPASGQLTIVAEGGEIEGPRGIGVRSDGCLVVVDLFFGLNPCCYTRKLLCIDPQTGEQGVIARYGYLSSAWGLAVFAGPSTPARPTSWGRVKARYRH